MFFPGETVLHTFVIPFDITDVQQVVISYKQNGAIILEKSVTSSFKEKEKNVCSFEVPFSQLDGMLFADDAPYTVQLNVYTKEGTRHTSHEMKSSSGIQYMRELMPATDIPEVIEHAELPSIGGGGDG